MKLVVRPTIGVFNWYADGAGTVRAGVAYNDAARRTSLLYRAGTADNFRVVDQANIAQRQHLKVPVLFPEPGKAIVFDDSDGFDAMYELDLASFKLGRKLFGTPGYDIADFLINDARTRVLTAGILDDRARTEWLDPDLAGVMKPLEAALAPAPLALQSLSRDGQAMLLKAGGPDQAGVYFFHKRGTNGMSRVGWYDTTLKAEHLNPVRTVRYAARDGLQISAVLTTPAGKPARNLPLIVFPHGGPGTRDWEQWDWIAQFMADRGYAVIQPNYRGSTGFGTAFERQGEGQWGLKMQDDLDDAVAYLGKEGIGDTKRTCIVGASYGGYAAMRAAERGGFAYRCAVSFAGVSDLPAILRYDRTYLSNAAATYWRRQSNDFSAISPIHGVANFTIPILLVHGRKDLRVPVAQSRDLAAKLKAAGKPVIYVEQPLGDHHLTRYEDRLQLLTETERFLDRYNPAD